MKGNFLPQAGLKYKAAMLLVIFYVIHLFAFNLLLANPDNKLSKHFILHNKTKAATNSDCLLLLAKKSPLKQSNSCEGPSLVPATEITLQFRQSFVSKIDIPLHDVSRCGNKLYRLFTVFLI